MSNITNQPSSTPPVRLEGLVPYRRQINYGLLVVGLAFLAIPIYLTVRHTFQVALGPVFLWACCMALVNVVLGLAGINYNPEGRLSEADKLRVQLLAVGGLVGLFTALLGFILPFTVYREPLSKGLEEWRTHYEALLWPGLAILGGLGLMFASLQLGRGLERQSLGIRRLIYGYNAVLTTLLLIAVLALPNVLAYAEPFTRVLGRPYDWTRDEVNSISERMRNYLADLREPIKVYLIMPRANAISMDTQTLLEHCRSLSNRFSWELVSPNDPQNRERLEEMMKKYTLSDPVGMLVTVGEEGSKGKRDHEFVRYRDLFRESGGMAPGSEPKMEYLGENALFNAMTSLTEGKVVLYFTQGHGELTAEPRNPMMRAPTRGGESMSNLRSKLSERKSFEVKNLTIDRTTKRVPDDATVVVIANPTQPFSEAEAKVLREYLQRKEEKDKEGNTRVAAGKIFLITEPIIQREGGTARMVRTGLEGLLAEYNIKLGDNRILNLGLRDPIALLALTNPNSPNPVAKAFFPSRRERQIFEFRNARTVETVNDKGPRAVDQLMLVPVDIGAWAETDLGVNPVTRRDALRENEEAAAKVISDRPLCFAVTVSDSGTPPGMPRDAAHAPAMKDTPRLVVFGAANWITDETITGNRGTLEVDLFTSCLSWLREKSSVGTTTIPAKQRQEYKLNIPETEQNRLLLLPPGLMVLGVLGVGLGVWVVRRR